MDIEVICSASICDYCRHKYNYNSSGHSCPYWFRDELCRDAEDFCGKELIEVSE